MKMSQRFRNAIKKRQPPSYESLALIRTRIDVSLAAQMLSLCLVLAFTDYCLIMIFEMLSLCLQGIPLKMWNIFLQTWPQILFNQPISNKYDSKVLAVYIWITLWLMLAFLIWMLRKYLRDFRGLRKAAHTQASGGPPINVSDYMRVSAAVWLTPQVINVPSPTALLDELQQGQDWSQHLADVLQNAPEEKRPPVTILISLSDRLTISIMGLNGKQELIDFQNDSWNAVLAFFALQNKGEWIPRKVAENKIYGAEHGDLLALHTSRINAHINRSAENAGFFNEPQFEGEQDKLDLFEQDKKDPHYPWRLSPHCDVEILSDLTTLYGQVLAAKAGQITLSRDALRRGYHQVLERYGKGLLAEHQEDHRIWSWLRDAYSVYRDQLLCVLEYAATCEWQVAQELAHSNVQECQEATWNSARFLGSSALIALGIVSRPDVGEPALIKCLERYYLLKDIDAANSVYQAYVERMLERDARWTPRLKILEIWPEVTRWPLKKKKEKKSS